MKILIAEDEPLMRKTICMKLEKEGYTVDSCVDGKEALQKLEEGFPDIVITDIMLPYASGLEILQFVKKKEQPNCCNCIVRAGSGKNRGRCF